MINERRKLYAKTEKCTLPLEFCISFSRFICVKNYNREMNWRICRFISNNDDVWVYVCICDRFIELSNLQSYLHSSLISRTAHNKALFIRFTVLVFIIW